MGIITQLYTLAAQATVNANQLNIPNFQASQGNLNSLLNTIYFWAGAVAVIVIIVAGFFYVVSTGEPAKVKRAKDAILYALIGLAVILMAFIITGLVIGGVSL